MPIDADELASLARTYTEAMTSIRGRRVQRLLKREFAGAECVLRSLAGVMPAVVGFSGSGIALCATDGRGKQASVVKWLHGSQQALEINFDLLKDSLPALSARHVPLTDSLRDVILGISPKSVLSSARPLLDTAISALSSGQVTSHV